MSKDVSKWFTAASDGNVAQLKQLVQLGKVNADTVAAANGAGVIEGDTALIVASGEGKMDAVRWLLEEAKADVNKRNKIGMTALHLAAVKGHSSLADALIRAGADIYAKESTNGWTALHYAAHNGHASVVDALIGADADITAKTNGGLTALDYAKMKNNEDCVALLERGQRVAFELPTQPMPAAAPALAGKHVTRPEVAAAEASAHSGYYKGFAQRQAAFNMLHDEDLRSEANIHKILELWDLRDRSADVQRWAELSQGNDGEVFKVWIAYKPYALKLFRKGLSEQFVFFHQALKAKHAELSEVKETAAAPGSAEVFRAAIPVGAAKHKSKLGLLYRYIVEPDPPRKPVAQDMTSVKQQMEFVHLLGFVHLDITDRNVLLSDDDDAYLMDYDCVCKIGDCPLGPTPPESSARVRRRDPVKMQDDLHLWQLLHKTFFNDLEG